MNPHLILTTPPRSAAGIRGTVILTTLTAALSSTNSIRHLTSATMRAVILSALSLLTIASLPAAMFSVPTDLQSFTDAWDISENGGSVVTATSGLLFGSGNAMFGASDDVIEDGRTQLFADYQPAGFLHYIEWQTASPISLTGYTLFAGVDGGGVGNRAFTEFRLLVYVDASLSYQTVDSFTVTDLPPNYLGGETRTFAALVGQQWRAEFVQYAEPSNASGPRIFELDAIGTSVVPEPETYALFSAVGLFAFAGWRRLRQPKGTDSEGLQRTWIQRKAT